MRLVWDIDEEWRDVVGAEDRYEVSDKGRVRAKSYLKHGRNASGPFSYITKPKLISLVPNSYGYLQVKLRRSNGTDVGVHVHRLVAQAFIPDPEDKPQVNHKDSNRANNVVGNLEWCTAQENVRHSYDFGLNSNAGDKHPRKVLTSEVVREIKSMWKEGKSVVNIAKELGFNRSTVSKVVHGNNWSNVE